jgi:Protein of unknown function (DUF3311)
MAHLDRRRTTHGNPRRWYWLLAIPTVLPLATPLYNRIDPRLFGVPFFYWCQLAFVVLAMAVIALVHRLTNQSR